MLKTTGFIFISIILLNLFGCVAIQSGFSNDAQNGKWSEATTPDPGLSGIIGKIENAKEIWPGKIIFVFVANFYGDTEGEGAFILEPNVFPKAQLSADGSFRIMNIAPTNYVLIVGPSAEMGITINDGGRVTIFNVLENQVLNIGSLKIDS